VEVSTAKECLINPKLRLLSRSQEIPLPDPSHFIGAEITSSPTACGLANVTFIITGVSFKVMKNQVLSDPAELVSRRRASEILGVTPRSIYRYEKAGVLTPIRLNCRVTRYRKEELLKLIADHTAS
jgi:hypothetical protein